MVTGRKVLFVCSATWRMAGNRPPPLCGKCHENNLFIYFLNPSHIIITLLLHEQINWLHLSLMISLYFICPNVLLRIFLSAATGSMNHWFFLPWKKDNRRTSNGFTLTNHCFLLWYLVCSTRTLLCSGNQGNGPYGVSMRIACYMSYLFHWLII